MTTNKSWAALVALLLLSTGAFAHTGHDTNSMMAGLVHPFGLDHLLAMVAVGVWSVATLPARKAWMGPVVFMLALIGSAIAGLYGLKLPFLEQAIALSVVLCGVMLLTTRYLAAGWGLGLIAVVASLHGLAHGAETPVSGFAGYALGFMLTTAALHLGGVLIGLVIHRKLAECSRVALGGLGLALGGAGFYLLSLV